MGGCRKNPLNYDYGFFEPANNTLLPLLSEDENNTPLGSEDEEKSSLSKSQMIQSLEETIHRIIELYEKLEKQFNSHSSWDDKIKSAFEIETKRYVKVIHW